MAAPQTAPRVTTPATDGTKTHRTKKRAKASSPMHADLIRIRKVAGMAISELARTAQQETPTDEACKRSMLAFSALIQASVNMVEAAMSR